MTAILKACLVAGMVLGFPQSVAEAKPPTQHAEERCLASAIKWEAGGEPLKGRRAVLDAVVNRAYARRLTICETIKQPKQFSFLRNKPLLNNRQTIRDTIQETIQHKRVLPASFQHFYSGPKPAWAALAKCVRISKQVFCELKEKK